MHKTKDKKTADLDGQIKKADMEITTVKYKLGVGLTPQVNYVNYWNNILT